MDASQVTTGSLHVFTRSGTDPLGGLFGTADDVTAGAQADLIRTFLGDDTIQGGGGNDTIEAGAGNDTAVFRGARADYTITADEVNGLLIVSGPDGTDTLKGVNALRFDDGTVPIATPGITLVGTNGEDALAGTEGGDHLDRGNGSDSLDGQDGNDTLTGGDGNDAVSAGAGDDVIVGGHGVGDDVYQGGAGIDTVQYASATRPITVDLGAGLAKGPEIGTDMLSGIDRLEGGAGNDVYFVDDVNDVVSEYLPGTSQDAGGSDLISSTVASPCPSSSRSFASLAPWP